MSTKMHSDHPTEMLLRILFTISLISNWFLKSASKWLQFSSKYSHSVKRILYYLSFITYCQHRFTGGNNLRSKNCNRVNYMKILSRTRSVWQNLCSTDSKNLLNNLMTKINSSNWIICWLFFFEKFTRHVAFVFKNKTK